MSERSAPGLVSERASRSGQPLMATLRVTDRCNYECAHCYQDHSDAAELSFDEIRRILGELADAGVLFLTLVGGEFFMRRDADDILRAARELGFAIRLKTTGHHIHERRADFLATLRPLQVEMSLYGAGPHVHEAVTRHPGSWQRTYQAARRLIERKIPVKLHCPVMASNLADVENLAALARDLGAVHSFDPKVTEKEDGDLRTTTLRMSWPELEAFYASEGTGVAEQLAATYGPSGVPPEERRRLDRPPCGAGQRGVTINPRGEVWPCALLQVPCGNLREQPFAEVWSGSGPLHEIRDLTWARLSECNTCALRPYCNRCHAMARWEQGELRGPSLEACRHAVATRDSLRKRGLVPATETALPPTWDRVDPDGHDHRRVGGALDDEPGVRRSPALRVLA